MKNSSFKPRTSPLQRTTFKSKGSTRMKSSKPKMTPIRKAARGEDCTLLIPGVCNFNPETVVLCHSNVLEDGKGMGLKAPDTEACFGCSSCHDILDGRAPMPPWMSAKTLRIAFLRARHRTHEILRRKGLISDPSSGSMCNKSTD